MYVEYGYILDSKLREWNLCQKCKNIHDMRFLYIYIYTYIIRQPSLKCSSFQFKAISKEDNVRNHFRRKAMVLPYFEIIYF